MKHLRDILREQIINILEIEIYEVREYNGGVRITYKIKGTNIGVETMFTKEDIRQLTTQRGREHLQTLIRETKEIDAERDARMKETLIYKVFSDLE